MAGKILVISTGASKLGELDTGLWLEELAAPYYAWTLKGYEVVIAAVTPGEIPLDAASLEGDFLTQHCKTFQQDAEAKSSLQMPVNLATVHSVDEYVAVFVPGGHGIVADGPHNKKLASVLADFYNAGKIVSSVCHGPCAFVGVTRADGKPLVDGKKVTGFSNSEEEAVGKGKYCPFLLEDKLKELGGIYSKGADWSAYCVVDGNLVTGQNPQSSEAVANAVLELLQKPTTV